MAGELVSINFDGFSLTDFPYKVFDYDPDGSPIKTIKKFSRAREHGSKRVFEKYEPKTIVIVGEVICADRVSLDVAMDNLKAQMRRPSGTLTIDYANGVRIYKGITASNVDFGRTRENNSYTPFSITFDCENPFATDGVTDTLINAQSITTNSRNFGFTIAGTMDANPVLLLQINAINPTNTAVQIIVGNTATSQNLIIEEIFKVGDVISIDCDNYRVFVSGKLVRAKGQFPQYAVGGGSIQYTDNAVSRTIIATATAERRYL